MRPYNYNIDRDYYRLAYIDLNKAIKTNEYNYDLSTINYTYVNNHVKKVGEQFSQMSTVEQLSKIYALRNDTSKENESTEWVEFYRAKIIRVFLKEFIDIYNNSISNTGIFNDLYKFKLTFRENLIDICDTRAEYLERIDKENKSRVKQTKINETKLKNIKETGLFNTFPYNLIVSLLGEIDYNTYINIKNNLSDVVIALYSSISDLTSPREKYIMHYRYNVYNIGDFMTSEEIKKAKLTPYSTISEELCKEYTISHERVRQLLHGVERNLKHPSVICRITDALIPKDTDAGENKLIKDYINKYSLQEDYNELSERYTNIVDNLSNMYYNFSDFLSTIDENITDIKSILDFKEPVMSKENRERIYNSIRHMKDKIENNGDSLLHYISNLESNALKSDYNILNYDLFYLMLHPRAFNILRKYNINTIKDLISKTEEELRSFNNLGRVSINDITHALKRFGLHLKNKNEEEPFRVSVFKDENNKNVYVRRSLQEDKIYREYENDYFKDEDSWFEDEEDSNCKDNKNDYDSFNTNWKRFNTSWNNIKKINHTLMERN